MSAGLRRPRVLVVGPTPPPAHGVAVVTRNLLESALAERFELVHVDTSDRRGLENIGRLDAGNVLLAFRHAALFARALGRGADLVYLPVARNALGFMRDALFLLPAYARGKPVVVHLHSGGYDEFLREAVWPLRALIRGLLSRAARIVVLGEVFRDMLSGTAAADRVAVVPNGTGDAARPAPRGDDPTGPVRVLFLGNLIGSKGYAELIHAIERLVDDGIDVRLTVAGAVADPGVFRRAESMVRHRDRIRFVDAVEGTRKEELLSTSHLLAFPTRYEYEAHPLVLLEAMAAGLPVVSTRHAAIPEIVVHERTGLLVDVGDGAALERALRRLVSDHDLRARMGQAARLEYERRYTADAWAQRLGDVFDAALTHAG